MTSKGSDFLIDENKIILMTRLALYEKKYLKEDKRRMSYFFEDYVYLKNFKSRLWITILMIGVMCLGAAEIVVEGIIFPISLTQFLEVYVKPYVVPWVILLITYTFISASVYGKRYKVSQKRYNKYKKLLRELEDYDNDVEGAADETK